MPKHSTGGLSNQPANRNYDVNTFEQITTFDNLLQAAEKARRGKRFRRASLEFFDNLEENLIQLQNELLHGCFVPGRYREFYVYEPKRRLISAPCFRDRVVHHAICAVIEPQIDKRFIFDSYACRHGKGTHAGADRAQRFIRIVQRNHGRVYALKADIAKYFQSIDHEILKRLLAAHVRCTRTLKVLCDIIDCSPTRTPGVGIPIGNLTSQLFANIYLNELDQMVKHQLRERYYVRYVDDFIVLHHDKTHLHRLRRVIEHWLWQQLRLKTNHKTQVFPVAASQGRALDFLGYRLYATHRLLRQCSVKRIKYKLRQFRKGYAAGTIGLADIRPSLASWLGHAKHAQSQRLIASLLRQPFTRGSHEAH